MTEQPRHRWYILSFGWFWTAMVLPVPDRDGVIDRLTAFPIPRVPEPTPEDRGTPIAVEVTR